MSLLQQWLPLLEVVNFFGEVFVSCFMLPGVRQLPTGKTAGLANSLCTFYTYTAVTSHNFSVLVIVAFMSPFNCKSTPSKKNSTSLHNLLKQHIRKFLDFKPKFTLGWPCSDS